MYRYLKYNFRFKEHPISYWTSKLRSQKFPSGPVNFLSEAFAHPQAEALKMVKEIEHQLYGKVKVVSPAVSYSTIENEVRTAPPVLGEHTVEILQNHAGLKIEDLKNLKERKIIDFPEDI